MFSLEESAATNRFIKFLSIPTVSSQGPSGPYHEAVSFLQGLFTSIGLPSKIIELVKGKPILLVTWAGKDPSQPSILLNSHYDVVPAEPAHWRTDPFQPVMDDKGDIFARGTQDMKCVCMQYVEAIGRLKASGVEFTRTVHLTYVPDEEVGGGDGLGMFCQTKEFEELNIAVALDEGLASPTDAFTVFYGERVPWWVIFRATGPTGHGSRFVKNTAMEKLINVVNKALAFRKSEEEKLHGGCDHGVAKKLGDVVTLNLTVLKGYVEGINGSYAFNVIPSEAHAGFDIRIPPSVNLADFEKLLNAWANEAEGVTVEFSNKNRLMEHHVTSTDGSQNPWWKVFSNTLEGEGLKFEPEVFPAATDSRFIRKLGLPCLGFSPLNNTPILLHDHNECVNNSIYLRGIKIYEKLITNMANAPQ